MYDILHKKLTAQLENNKVDETANKKRISELNRQIELLEERFVLKKITAELFAKFSQKYQSEIDKLNLEIFKHINISSNLKKSVKKVLEITQNISQMWLLGDFYDKQKL